MKIGFMPLVLSLFIWAGCASSTPHIISSKEVPQRTDALTVAKARTADTDSRKFFQDRNSLSAPPSEKKMGDTMEDQGDMITGPIQEILDAAMDFIQTSNDFWEKGDLDNGLEALDNAYALILKVGEDADPELLQQKEDLRFTISKRIMEIHASRFTTVNGISKAIPLDMNHHVERALESFKGGERDSFLNAYRRSGKYRPSIVKALQEAGIPAEISWLPLIESGFNVRAFSSARALGLWQFIASTGYRFGLERNEWIDERMDPGKSTQAAIGYLKELHQIFGDWSTVLAAYNCGELRVLNQIRKQKINYLDNFWDLYRQLPQETAFYYPRFLAVLHILNNPKAHGFVLPPVDSPLEVEEVTIDKQIHLETIASRLDIDFEMLKMLNPELRQYLTPDTPYNLQVPLGKGDLLLAKLDNIPLWKPLPPSSSSSPIVHKVSKNETLTVIAKRYNTSVDAIMEMNSLKKKNPLPSGSKLKIPTSKSAVIREVVSPLQMAKRKENVSEYVVKRGDNLWSIAQNQDTTVQSIRSYNQLTNTDISAGQVLKIPKAHETSKPAKSLSYTVQKGDYPALIARKHQMELSSFLKLNGMRPSCTIFPGQTVLVQK